MSSGVTWTGLVLPVPVPVLFVTAGAAKTPVAKARNTDAARAAFGSMFSVSWDGVNKVKSRSWKRMFGE
jgi:hypothetical protein